MIHSETIEEINRRLDIVEVIGDFVPLKKVGQNYKAISPFTNEKTPSFFVVPAKNFFKDFSSGKAGNAVTFLMEHEGLDYVGAVRYLAQKYTIPIRETNRNTTQQRDRDSLYELMDFAAKYYQHTLLDTDEGKRIGLTYFKERGFNPTSMQAFELGYACDRWDALLKEATRQGYTENLLEQVGLIIKKQDSSPYDRFRKRILFPIHNLSGKTIAFGARTFTQEKKQPKYINSPETSIYHKSKTLYGLFRAKKTIRQHDNCYVAEGYTDVISLHQSGIQNTVSPLGTTLTLEQIGLIKRFTHNITLLFDGDIAGLQATMRGIDLILKSGLNVYVILFPEGNDPDSYLSRVGTAEFNTFLQTQRKDFVSFKADYNAKKSARDPLLKARAIEELISTIALVPDDLKKMTYLQHVAHLFNIEERVLQSTLHKETVRLRKEDVSVRRDDTTLQSAHDVHDPVTSSSSSVSSEDMIQYQERETIRLLLNYADNTVHDTKLSNFIWKELEDVLFTNPVYKEIYETFTSRWAAQKPVDREYFFRQGNEHVKKVIADLSVCRYNTSTYWKEKYLIHFPEEHEVVEKLAYTNVMRLKLRIVQQMARQNRLKIKQAEAENNAHEIDKLIEDQIQLDEAKTQLSNNLGIVIV